MAKRPSDIDATLLQLEILRRIPKLPAKIDAKSLHQQLLDAGFERDIRTVQRSLKMLCEHFDIECDERSKPFGYSWKIRSEGLALPILNEQQSLLLKLAEQQLKYLLPANLMASMKPFFEQADRMVSGAKDKPEYQWLNKVCSTPTSLPLIPAKIKEEIFNSVSQALFQNKLLKIEYQNQHGKKHQATIMPLAISQQGASIYLVCRYEGFDDNRCWLFTAFVKRRFLLLVLNARKILICKPTKMPDTSVLAMAKKLALPFRLAETPVSI
ncbi:hypothetical protein NJNGDCLN_02582 [Mannheimia haemolytica]